MFLGGEWDPSAHNRGSETDREFVRITSNPLTRDANEFPPQTVHISPHLPSLYAVLPLLQPRQLLFRLLFLTST